nr:hypothetical protein [uncultured Sphingorhabdus sp.]
MLQFVSNSPEPFITGLIASVGWLLAQWLRRKPNLQYSVGHSWNHLVDQPLLDADGKVVAEQQLLRTASINVTNAGSESATSLEITFNWKPQNYNVWPARHFQTVINEDRRFTIKLESLAPNEFFRMEIMSTNAELPLLASVRCKECEGKLIPMGPQRIWPTWVIAFLLFLMGSGALALIYAAVSLVTWLIQLGN